MSHGAVRGGSSAAQRHLDRVLAAAGAAGAAGAGAGAVSLPQLMYHCLSTNPQDLFMINGATGERITNAQILKHAVFLARAIVAKGARGNNVMILMRNHQYTAAVYFAVQFAGTVPFIMDPNTTAFEISYFLKLIKPCMVFCDGEHRDLVQTALEDLPDLEVEVNTADTEEHIIEIAKGFSDDTKDFVIPDADVDSTVMMLPTSGSTGPPKATLMTHRGLIVTLPQTWTYHSKFPRPTALCMVLTTPQWVTYSMTTLTCVAYRVPLLMSPRPPTVPWVKEMLLLYRPTWTFFGPAFVSALLPTLTRDHLSSLETLYLLGAPSPLELKAALKELVPPTAVFGDVYGTTETQGYITAAHRRVPLKSTGIVLNNFEYKLLDDEGREVKPGQPGELYVRGPSLFKGYYKSPEKSAESFVDGWFRTGDAFYADEQEHVYYVERKKFCFKYLGSHVSPEEVEAVVTSVAGVEACVVCATERGPAAIVVRHQASSVTREQIHQEVNGSLSHHKRLHGGIAFVPSLPHTHSGKIKREECKKLIKELLNAGKCI